MRSTRYWARDFQGLGCGAEGFECGEGVGDKLVGVFARLLDAVDSGPGGLDAGGILAGGLAEFFGGLGHVENVIDDLEGEAGFFAEGAEAWTRASESMLWGTRLAGGRGRRGRRRRWWW